MEIENIKGDTKTVTKCFFEHLKSLCLNEYPIYSRKLNVIKNRISERVLKLTS